MEVNGVNPRGEPPPPDIRGDFVGVIRRRLVTVSSSDTKNFCVAHIVDVN
jgi:hypothetical protein